MRKTLSVLVVAVALIAAGTYYWYSKQPNPPTNVPIANVPQNNEPVSVVAENLDIPWDFAFLPDGGMLVTERTGSLLLIGADRDVEEIATRRPELRGESGLLGITLHPDFAANRYLYLYMTTRNASDQTINRVERYRFEDDALTDEKLIIDNIPGATYHDGGRMEFGPDGKLYITTGDATKGAIAQDKKSLGGKILRLNDDGSIPSDNPFANAVWSYGHRNPQGLAWDSAGRLWETEHGPTGEQGLCCRDEVNLIVKGANYGWPTIAGDTAKSGMIVSARNSGTDTWAPASAAVIGNSLFFGGLAGEALFEATLDGTSVTALKKYFEGEYGRIRTVRLGPDGYLYFSTSNRDGRGTPVATDDRIIRVDPKSLK